MRRRPSLVLAAAAVVLAAGCRVDVGLDVAVGSDGSGEVEVVVRLDRAAAERVPDLAEQLEVADLEAAGWDVEGPDPAGGGGLELSATKAFASLAGLDDVLAEVSGADGPLADLRVRQERSTFGDRWLVRGEADLREGLEAFGDEALRARLGGTSLGASEAELEEAAGRPLEEAVRFTVRADLPGGGRSWEPRLGERTPLVVTSRSWHVPRLALAGLAVLAGLAALAVLARGGRRRRTPHPGRRHAPAQEAQRQVPAGPAGAAEEARGAR